MLDLRFAYNLPQELSDYSGEDLMTPEEIANHPLGKVLFDRDKITPEFIENKKVTERWIFAFAFDVFKKFDGWSIVNSTFLGEGFDTVELPEVTDIPVKEHIYVPGIVDGFIQRSVYLRNNDPCYIGFLYGALVRREKRYNFSDGYKAIVMDLIDNNIPEFGDYLFDLMDKYDNVIAYVIDNEPFVPIDLLEYLVLSWFVLNDYPDEFFKVMKLDSLRAVCQRYAKDYPAVWEDFRELELIRWLEKFVWR